MPAPVGPAVPAGTDAPRKMADGPGPGGPRDDPRDPATADGPDGRAGTPRAESPNRAKVGGPECRQLTWQDRGSSDRKVVTAVDATPSVDRSSRVRTARTLGSTEGYGTPAGGPPVAPIGVGSSREPSRRTRAAGGRRPPTKGGRRAEVPRPAQGRAGATLRRDARPRDSTALLQSATPRGPRGSGAARSPRAARAGLRRTEARASSAAVRRPHPAARRASRRARPAAGAEDHPSGRPRLTGRGGTEPRKGVHAA
jgi:hypothetical protein